MILHYCSKDSYKGWESGKTPNALNPKPCLAQHHHGEAFDDILMDGRESLNLPWGFPELRGHRDSGPEVWGLGFRVWGL